MYNCSEHQCEHELKDAAPLNHRSGHSRLYMARHVQQIFRSAAEAKNFDLSPSPPQKKSGDHIVSTEHTVSIPRVSRSKA